MEIQEGDKVRVILPEKWTVNNNSFKKTGNALYLGKAGIVKKILEGGALIHFKGEHSTVFIDSDYLRKEA